MKKEKYFQMIFSLIFLLAGASLSAQAQESLKINSIFDKYGKQKGATLVVLTGEALNSYRLDVFRSLTIKYDKTILNDIQNAVEKDKGQAREIKEVINNGIISSGYYQLPEENEKINRYILFKIGNDGVATLIYMEGRKESEQLIRNLFIKKK